MSYRGSETEFYDFTGGMASNSFGLDIAANQAQLLRNIILSSDGGFEKRRGNTTFNSSAMVGATTAVTSLFYYKLAAGTQFLTAMAGTKIFKADDLDGVMDDITGAVTITSGQNNIWTESQINDIAIYVGGAPDAPIKWTGSGNAAALGGSPVSGNFGFSHNNRMFIGNTAANPSTIYWSILGNPEDWSASGSGSQDIEKNDGDTLIGAAPLNTSMVLLFKQNSIHQFLTATAPFPYFPLFKGVGAVGKKAIVVADGVAYFITPQARMKSTDGTKIQEYPESIDDIWDGLNKSRLQYIVGKRYTGMGFDHIVWMCSNTTSTTNNLAIIWDLKNKCWLQHTTGYKANVAALTQSGVLYTGHYNGKIYKQDVLATYSDASETSPGGIDALWRSGFGFQKSIEKSLQLSRINIAIVSQTSGSLNVGYGFNFNTDQFTKTIDMQSGGGIWDSGSWDVSVWGGQTDIVRTIFIQARGNNFQVSFANSAANEAFKIHGYTVSGKQSAVKNFQIS